MKSEADYKATETYAIVAHQGVYRVLRVSLAPHKNGYQLARAEVEYETSDRESALQKLENRMYEAAYLSRRQV